MIISTAEEMNPLRRSNMEDVHVVTDITTTSCSSAAATVAIDRYTSPQQHQQQQDHHLPTTSSTTTTTTCTYKYLAIYDGHGGRDTVDFLQQALHVNVQEELQHSLSLNSSLSLNCRQNDEKSSNISNISNNQDKENKENNLNDSTTSARPATAALSGSNATTSIPECLERALLVTDIQARQYGITSSGSTVAMCLIHIPTNTLYTANVGDARIVHGQRRVMTHETTSDDDTKITTNYVATRLSHDHSAQDPVEINRITQDKGGFCFKGRVAGVLAVARSLGDFGLKEFVTAEPYTHVHNQQQKQQEQEQDNQFVILACDGVWDVLSDQQAVDIVSQFEGNKEDVAAKLTKYAIQRGTTDNITVVVCWL
jgi:serine/threonine protein phosphatase PrpC